MAEKDKITQKDVIDKSVADEVNRLNESLKDSIKLMGDFAKLSTDAFKSSDLKNIQDITKSVDANNKVREQNIEVNKKAITTAEKLRQKTKEVSIETERGKIALQKKRKEIRETIKAEKAQAGSINDLNRKNKILRERIKNVSNETVSGRKRIIAYNRAIDRNEKKIDAASDAMTRQKRGIGKYSSALKGLGSTLGLVTGGLALAGAAIRKGIQITKQAIEVNRLFEKSFTNVLTLLDEAEKKEFRVKLAEGAVDIIANYGLSIEDTNKALFDAISAGVDAGESIEFLNKAAKLAIAGNAELSTVVDGATNIMNAYGDQIKNVDDVFSVFFAGQVEGKTDVAALASNIGKLAPIASSVDFKMNELFATTALLTKQIGSTEEATTVLRQVMASVIKPTAESVEVFKKLGISTGAAAIKEEGFLNIFKQVTDAAKDNEDVLAELIPNIRALTGASALGTEQFDELEQIIAELNDTELSSIKVQNAFNEQMNTSAKQAELLEGRWKRLLITIGGGDSIFKKIGTGIRSQLSQEIDNLTEKIEIFRAQWSRLTGELSKQEYRESLVEIHNRFNDIGTSSDEAKEQVISDNEAVTNSFKNESNKRVNIELGEKEEIVKIKEKANEDVLALIEEQDEKELELLDEKLTNEIDLLLGNEEEKFMTIEELRQQDIANQIAADIEKGESNRRYIDFAIAAASQLSNSIFGFLNAQLNAQLNADIEKAKSRGASEKEIAKIEKDAAKKRQSLALTQAIINTALAVTSGLLTQPFFPAGIIMGVLAAALGAIEIAAISSESFAKGVKDTGSKGMVAEVGERGTERINYADGTSVLTPNGSTYTYLPPHSEVVPNHRLQQDLADMQMIGNKRGSRQEDDQRQRADQRELMKAIRNRDETTINITEGGFYVTAKRGENRIKYITRKYRS